MKVFTNRFAGLSTMAMQQPPLSALQWSRGLRGGLAVGASIVGSHLLGQSEGWVALSSFYVVLADNGGPYFSRFKTLGTLLIGGMLSILLGALASGSLVRTLVVTGAICFLFTFARVVSQHVASTSILTLVIYFAMLSPHAEGLNVLWKTLLLFFCGWLWGACLSLFLWPLDAFRPARQAVAQCYRTLEHFALRIADTTLQIDVDEESALRSAIIGYQRQMRLDIEAARHALEQTPARAPVRTLRARNLSVLLEVADILFAATIRAGELKALSPATEQDHFSQWVRQMSKTYATIAENLAVKPADRGFSFALGGADRTRLSQQEQLSTTAQNSTTLQHMQAEQRETQETIALAFDALYSIWSGLEQPLTVAMRPRLDAVTTVSRNGWENVRSNWTLESLTMRHALRVATVGIADAGVMLLLNVNHGFWLAMTSLLVLQPYAGHTIRRSLQRVRGTLAGGILAALLTVSLQWPPLLIAVITVCAVLTCAFYAVDYAWYCFFLTPTFVLMNLPKVHDWGFTGIRVALTLMGVSISLAAMRILWPETERLNLAKLFARCCAADAAYARSILELWPVRGTAGEDAVRQRVAACRRACGLASNDAEECVERLLLEPEALSRRGILGKPAARDLVQPGEERWQHELTFVTYIRRLTQSLLAFARIASGEADEATRLADLAGRLENLGAILSRGEKLVPAGGANVAAASEDLVHRQTRRLERQVSVLERSVASAHLAVAADRLASR